MPKSRRDDVEMPPRDATDTALAQLGHTLRWTFDVDLGELCEGHHVIARGIQEEAEGASLHYEFVPGITRTASEGRPFFWYWMLYATDDIGTQYEDYNSGAVSEEGGAASHGTRDIGGLIPSGATQLTLRFEPAASWAHPGKHVRELVIDLHTGQATTRP